MNLIFKVFKTLKYHTVVIDYDLWNAKNWLINYHLLIQRTSAIWSDEVISRFFRRTFVVAAMYSMAKAAPKAANSDNKAVSVGIPCSQSLYPPCPEAAPTKSWAEAKAKK